VRHLGEVSGKGENGYVCRRDMGVCLETGVKGCCRDSQEPGPLFMSWVLWDSP